MREYRYLGLSSVLQAFLLLALVSCAGNSAYGVYPPSWPLEELVLPRGAEQIKEPYAVGSGPDVWYTDGLLLNKGEAEESTIWKLAFAWQVPYGKVEKHFDDILLPLGYEVAEDTLRAPEGVPGDPTRWTGGEKWYLTPDREREVSIGYHELPPVVGVEGFKGWRLEVHFWTNGKPQ